MKRTLLLLALLAGVACAAAQPVSGKKFEISLSGSYQSFSVSSDGYSASGSSVFMLSPRVGFFVVKGLEIEPELTMVLGSGDGAFAINGNLSYNFALREKNLVFLLAGYGAANVIPVTTGVLPVGSLNITMGVLNLGGGLKLFLNDNVAMRVEYRYQHFTGRRKEYRYDEHTLDGPVSPSSTTTYTLSSVLFGFSIFP